jgi:hypothetical protein
MSQSTTTAHTTTTVAVEPVRWAVEPLAPELVRVMTGRSWHRGCPVAPSSLRLLHVRIRNFSGVDTAGELVVNRDAAFAVISAFQSMYVHGFRIRQVRLVDAFGGSDEASMVADNTSAFNCRLVPGTNVWSQHSFGRAVDVNPLENPEVGAGRVDPPQAAAYVDRSRHTLGMIHFGDAAWKAFAHVGWPWGGQWRSLKDYQHFSANGL